MKSSIAPPAPFDGAGGAIDDFDCPMDRGSGPACSLFPRWRPSMKPSIEPLVLFDETIDSLRQKIGAVVLQLQVYF